MESSWQPIRTENPRRSKFTAPLELPQTPGSTKAELPGVGLGMGGWVGGGSGPLLPCCPSSCFLAWLKSSASGPEDLLCWEVRWPRTLEDGVGGGLPGPWGTGKGARMLKKGFLLEKESPVQRSIWTNRGKGRFLGHK